jgi:hypothetical protein
VIHTVTSGTGPIDPNHGKQFDSGLLVKGQSVAHTFKTKGWFMFCHHTLQYLLIQTYLHTYHTSLFLLLRNMA